MMSMGEDGDRRRQLEVVTIDDLNVDHSYQRALNQNLVERILAQWDMVAADAITVSRRKNGKLYIVNGQHRAAAAKLAGETEILAFVYDGLTRAEEADLRLKANNRRSDNQLERFQAQLTQGNKESKAIKALLAEFDTMINRTANKHTGINCVACIESLYRLDAVALRRTLQALHEAHGDLRGDSVTVPPLRGTFWFITHHHDYKWRELIDRLDKAGVDDLLRRGRSHQSVQGGPLWLNYYRAIVEAYNYRRTEEKRLETITKFWGIPGERAA